MKILNLIKNAFKIARLLSADDSANIRLGKVKAFGKEQNVMLMTPYGLMHNPPENSLVCLWNQMGQESNGIGMADDPKNRLFKDLLIGEVACANYAVGNYIKFCNTGITEINGNDDNFVGWTAFNAAMQWFTTFYNNHVHAGGQDPDLQMPDPWNLELLKTATVKTKSGAPYVPPT